MWIQYLFYLVLMKATVSSAINSCRVYGDDPCQFEVTCEVYAGGASLSTCNGEPNALFTVTSSKLETITAAFFGSTNFDSRVRHFRAINNSWTNIEALTFRYYAKILTIDLSNNRIESIRNEAFKNLFKMTSLNLSRNAIEVLYPKSFFIADSRVSDLAILDLSYNKISVLSTAFNQVPSLQTLFLQNNQISSLPDDSLSDLKQLNSLSFAHNYLTSINMTMVHMKSLKNLDLSFNKITKLSGYEINRVVLLETFNVSYNDMEAIESNCFNQAYNLQSLDLRCNKLSLIDHMVFMNNINLTYINLFNNSISKIEDDAFKNNPLSYLYLELNNITNEVTKNTLSGIKNLISLDLANQSISKIQNNSFSIAINLIYLNISRNKIVEIETASFENPTSLLKVLDLSYNTISNINFLEHSLVNLLELYLNGNSIVSIKNGSFNNQLLLKKLDISMNKIIKIEQNSLPLAALQYLNLNDNLLQGDITNNTFSPAKYLRSLELSNFNLTTVGSGAFINMPVVTKLNLSHDGITYMDANNFQNIKNLYSIDLSYNKLSKLEINNNALSSLKAVWLNNNRFQNIADAFFDGSTVLYLDISHNEISNVADKVFVTLKNLKVLNLSFNKVTSFNNPYTDLLTSLVDLRLSANSLEYVDLSKFKELVNVDLSYNSIKSINISFFHNLDYLQSLDLSNNIIVDLYPGTFQNVIILKRLNISSNKIQRLRYGSLKGLHRTEVLDLSNNTLEEIDVDVLHECTELRRLIIDENQISSIDIERLITLTPKISLISLGGNPISCREIVRNMKKFNKTAAVQVEVTSLNKVYHEDNVHGIKCGEKVEVVSATPIMEIPVEVGISHTTVLLIWCTVLTLLIVVGSVAFYFYKRGDVLHINREYRSQSSNSLELNGSEFQRDLLT